MRGYPPIFAKLISSAFYVADISLLPILSQFCRRNLYTILLQIFYVNKSDGRQAPTVIESSVYSTSKTISPGSTLEHCMSAANTCTICYRYSQVDTP